MISLSYDSVPGPRGSPRRRHTNDKDAPRALGAQVIDFTALGMK
jgi:hypothetical protein